MVDGPVVELSQTGYLVTFIMNKSWVEDVESWVSEAIENQDGGAVNASSTSSTSSAAPKAPETEFQPICVQNILRFAELQEMNKETDKIVNGRGGLHFLAGDNICPSCPPFNFTLTTETHKVSVNSTEEPGAAVRANNSNWEQAELVVTHFLEEDHDLLLVSGARKTPRLLYLLTNSKTGG